MVRGPVGFEFEELKGGSGAFCLVSTSHAGFSRNRNSLQPKRPGAINQLLFLSPVGLPAGRQGEVR